MKGQLEKRGAGVYRIRWYLGRDVSGNRRYGSKTIRGTKKAAQRALRKVLALVDEVRRLRGILLAGGEAGR